MEPGLQKDFGDLFERIVARAQQDLDPWRGSPYRELVAGIAPRAVQGVMVRCLVALLDRHGIHAVVPPRGDRAAADLRIGSSRHFLVKTATRKDHSSSTFEFHGLDDSHPTLLLAIAPQRIASWIVQPALVPTVIKHASNRLELDPSKQPWNGDPCGDGTLSALLANLRKGL
jgi:hypothetical protein